MKSISNLGSFANATGILLGLSSMAHGLSGYPAINAILDGVRWAKRLS